MKVSLVIPCFNEEEVLPDLFSALNKLTPLLAKDYETEVILVDDGSRDKTSKLLRDYAHKRTDVKVLKHKANRGLGAALKTGFANASGDAIVTLDSDLTYDPLEIPRLLALMNGNADIVAGSPYHPVGKCKNVSPPRLLLSKVLSRIYRIVLRAPDIYTFSGMFRAYRSKVIRDVSLESNDFLVTTEILVKAIKRGFKIKEFPTTLHGRVAGSSKLKVPHMIARHLTFIFDLIFRKERLK